MGQNPSGREKGKGKRRKVGAEVSSYPSFVREDKEGAFLSPLSLALSPFALPSPHSLLPVVEK